MLLSLAVALLCAGAATAGNGPAKFLFRFQGQLTATPSNGGVPITVQGGNKAALRAMLGQSVAQTFAYGSTTEFLKWSHGIPTVVQAGDLAAGDYVTVNVRAPRKSALAAIEQQAAGIVGDHGTSINPPNKPAVTSFRGTLTSVGASGVTVHVTGGDRRAAPTDRQLERRDLHVRRHHDLPALAGQGADRSIDASKLVVGDRIVRIRADKGALLSTVLATPANHIGDRGARSEVVLPGVSHAQRCPTPAWLCAFGPFFYRGLTRITKKGTQRYEYPSPLPYLAATLVAVATASGWRRAASRFRAHHQPVLRREPHPRRGARRLADRHAGLADRPGVITAIVGTSITLREKDGTSVTLPVDPNARVQGPARFSNVALLRRRLRVVLYHQANLPATLVQVEGVAG
jgi:hypothetical protein